MNGGRYRSVRGGKHLAAVLRKPKLRTEEILCCSCAETNDNLGRTAAISFSSQGQQAAISRELGFLCSRILPRGSHLKCFTALVT